MGKTNESQTKIKKNARRRTHAHTQDERKKKQRTIQLAKKTQYTNRK